MELTEALTFPTCEATRSPILNSAFSSGYMTERLYDEGYLCRSRYDLPKVLRDGISSAHLCQWGISPRIEANYFNTDLGA